MKPLSLVARRLRVLELRGDGFTFDEIAAQLTKEGSKVSTVTVWRDYEASMKRLEAIERGEADSLRRLEVRRLDRWQAALNKKLKAGNVGAIRTALEIVKVRATLNGLLTKEAQRSTVQIGTMFVNVRAAANAPRMLDQSDAALVAIVQKALTDGGAGADQAAALVAEIPEILDAEFVEVEPEEVPGGGLDEPSNSP